MKKKLLLSLFALSLPVMPAFAADAAAAKNDLIAKLIKLQQPGINALGREIAEQPLARLGQQASMALQGRVAEEKRPAVAKELQTAMKAYADDAGATASAAAIKLAPTTVGPLLEKNFTQAELKQLLAFLESPVSRKFQQVSAEMQQTLGQKIVEEVGPQLGPKVQALEQNMAKILGITAESAPK